MYGEQILWFAVPLIVLGVLYRWFWAGELEPDPWEQSEEKEESKDEGEPICQRCLNLTAPGRLFCPNCGASLDSVTAMMPWVSALALGDVMRSGVHCGRHPSSIVRIGCLLSVFAVAIAFFPLGLFLFAPAYLYLYYRNSRRQAVA